MPFFRFTVHPSQRAIEVLANDREKAEELARSEVDLELQTESEGDNEEN
jgi:hypothetical protein